MWALKFQGLGIWGFSVCLGLFIGGFNPNLWGAELCVCVVRFLRFIVRPREQF